MSGIFQSLIAIDAAGSIPPPPTPADITWANLTSETLIAGNELQATAGGYVAGGSSSESLGANVLGYVEVTAKVSGSYLERLWGMGTTNTGGGFARMKFAIDLGDAGAAWFLFTDGSPVGGFRGTFIAGDIFRITRFADGTAQAQKNGGTPIAYVATSTAAMYANGGAQSTNTAKMENMVLLGFA